MLGFLRVVFAIVVTGYGILCLILGFTRQGGGTAKVNMILIPAIFAICIFRSETFYDFVMNNFDSTFLLIIIAFVGSGIISIIYELELVPGLINGVGLITVAMWVSGIFSQETVVLISRLVARGMSIFFIPFVFAVFVLHFIYR